MYVYIFIFPNFRWLCISKTKIRIFCNLLICFVFDGFLQLICFQIFCSKHSTTNENTYILSCSFESS